MIYTFILQFDTCLNAINNTLSINPRGFENTYLA